MLCGYIMNLYIPNIYVPLLSIYVQREVHKIYRRNTRVIKLEKVEGFI